MRRTLSIASAAALAALTITLLLGYWRPASGESGAQPIASGSHPQSPGRLVAGLGRSDTQTGYPPPVTGRIAASIPSGGIGSALIGGWASYADPKYGPDYLATRFPRGTKVTICGQVSGVCQLMVVNDFGPSAAISPPRVADIALVRWLQICAVPKEIGLCLVTIETTDVALPATSTEDGWQP